MDDLITSGTHINSYIAKNQPRQSILMRELI